jgi:hypothetical protein
MFLIFRAIARRASSKLDNEMSDDPNQQCNDQNRAKKDSTGNRSGHPKSQ